MDIFAFTETWLQPGDSDNYTIAELCPTGYFFHHVPREDSRGGGVGLLLKKRIQIKRQCLRTFKSFEYIDVLVKCSNDFTRFVTIYRPPPSRKNGLNNKTFLDEFATLAEQLVVVPGNLLIVGDFNYHLDANSDTDAKRFNNILESFNLHQHVNVSTHKHGHTLDLVITRSDDDFVTGVEIKDPLLSDHSAVHCKLRLKKPPLEQVEVEYRKLRSIDMDCLCNDLKKSALISADNYTDLPTLIDEYEDTLKNILDIHAPIKRVQ